MPNHACAPTRRRQTHAVAKIPSWINIAAMVDDQHDKRSYPPPPRLSSTGAPKPPKKSWPTSMEAIHVIGAASVAAIEVIKMS